MTLKVRSCGNILVFAALIFANIRYLYLVNIDNNIIYFSFPISIGIQFDIFALLLALIWGTYWWIKLIHLPNPKYNFIGWILAIIIMIFLSSLQSYLRFGQSLFLGFIGQKDVLVWSILYFPIRKFIYYKKITYDDVIRILWIISILQLVIFISQYFVGYNNMFTYVHIASRNGRIRYYFNPILLDFIFMICLDIVNKKRGIGRLIGGAIAGTILFEVMFVQQYRLTSMGLIICLGMFVLLVRAKTEYRITYIAIGMLILGILLNTSLVQDVLNQVLNNSFDQNLQIRSVGRSWYIKTLIEHPFLGGGFPNTKCEVALLAAGEARKIYLADNGIFSFAYIYGWIGCVWFISLWIKLLKDGMQIRKKASECAFVLYPLFFIITCINEIHWYFEYGFVIFVIFLCLAEEKIEMIKSTI